MKITKNHPPPFLLFICGFYLILSGLAFVIATYTNLNVMHLPFVKPFSTTILLSVSVALLVVGISYFSSKYIPQMKLLEIEMSKFILPISINSILLISIFSAIGEELIFRGILLPHSDLISSSIIFGLAHFIPRKEFIPWSLFALVLGFLLGGLYLFTGNLIAPIITHFLVNAINISSMKYKFENKKPTSKGDIPSEPL